MTRLLLVVAIVIGMMSLKNKATEKTTSEYWMEIHNDHDVMLVGINSNDTIVISLENAFALEGQSEKVFVSK